MESFSSHDSHSQDVTTADCSRHLGPLSSSLNKVGELRERLSPGCKRGGEKGANVLSSNIFSVTLEIPPPPPEGGGVRALMTTGALLLRPVCPQSVPGQTGPIDQGWRTLSRALLGARPGRGSTGKCPVVTSSPPKSLTSQPSSPSCDPHTSS